MIDGIAIDGIAHSWRAARIDFTSRIASGELVAFALVSVMQFGPTKFLMHRYADASSEEAFEALLHTLPALAHENGCEGCGGYTPTLDWIISMYERSQVFKRQTTTEQHEFHWKNADYA